MNQRDRNPRPGMGRRSFLGGTLGTTGAALLGGLVSAPSARAASSGGLGVARPVRTESGLVTGVPAALPGITVFKGIPYGASTAGPNRWRPPQKPASWSGVHRADSFGPACPQSTTGLSAGQYPALSEDCLNLNVWTGATDPDQRRPVFVWAYGGASSAMWASQGIYDGAGLAAKGLVAVTFNRRIAAFGSLATKELADESGHGSTGNYELLDVIACLQWVQRNIAAFGGDPDRVVLAGWSAGASCTFDLLCSPMARGLFSRALAESGVQYTKDPALDHLAGTYATMAQAQATGAAFLKQLGVTTMAQAREVSTDQIVKYGSAIHSHVLDGYVLPATYTEILQNGAQNDVPFMTGNNKDENNGFMAQSIAVTSNSGLTVAQYRQAAESEFGSMADRFLELYPASTTDQAGQMAGLAAQDDERISTYLLGTQWCAHGSSPIYQYFWTHTPPGKDTTNPVTPGDASGVYHGAEMYYVFDNLYATDRPWDAADHRIADAMSSYVANFAATGNPNDAGDRACRHARLAHWPALDDSRERVMETGDAFRPVPVGSTEARYQFFKDFFASQSRSW